jgi:protein TonB
MKRTAGALPLAAVGASLVAHLLFVLLVPYRAVGAAPVPSRELIPVRLIEAPPHARSAAIRRAPARPAPAAPARVEAPQPHEAVHAEQAVPAEQPSKPPEILPQPLEETLPRVSQSVAAMQREPAAEATPAAPGEAPAPTTAPEARSAPHASAGETAADAAYEAITSTLQSRLQQAVSYPLIARANGWEGTVILAVRLDAEGRVEQAVVRQSSGHEVLDQAAIKAVRKVTPVPNPLTRPITIQVPIVYRLK